MSYDSRVLVADTDRRNSRDREAEERREALGFASGLPTGRVTYRTLDEINAELRELAAAYPGRVKLFRSPYRSLLGRPVWGIEISHDVHTDSGKPVFLNTASIMRASGPRPSSCWSSRGRRSSGTGPIRASRRCSSAPVIAVPVVNPDGYDISRSLIQEQKRKNCRVNPGEIPSEGQCTDPANFSFGVDPNRNYGAFWGGPGSSADRTASNHRGEAPWSEPEIRNMRALSAANQVTVAINNHTPDERLLRAPSSSNEPVPADVVVYDALAQMLGADLDFPAGPWTEIYYEASGTAEQTAYYGSGTLAFTPRPASMAWSASTRRMSSSSTSTWARTSTKARASAWPT